MVRNPFERLLSGYRDKGWNGYFPDKVRLPILYRAHKLDKPSFQTIVNKEAGIFNDKEYRKGNDSSIEDFDRKDLEGFNLFLDQLILSGPEIGVGGHFGVRSRHWTRYYDICHFCAIDYDVVAKVENVDIESSYIVKRAG